MDESSVAAIVTIAESYLNQLEEALDDAFCEKLLAEAHKDNDMEYSSFDDFVRELRNEVE